MTFFILNFFGGVCLKNLYKSVSAMIQDHREKNLRLQELKTLQKNIEALIRPNRMNNEVV
jgi:hypothetical protein